MLVRFKGAILFKILIGLVIFFILLLITLRFVLPGQLKEYIESKDKDWIDREIVLQEITFNPLTFKTTVNDLAIKEKNSNDDFVSFGRLYIDVDFWDLIKSKITINELTVNELYVSVIQNGTQFNFSDLINGDKAENTTTEDESTVFNLYDITVLNSRIKYVDSQLGNKIVLDSITIKDEVFRSIDTVFDASIGIHQLEGGWLKGDVSYNLSNDNYSVNSKLETWKLSPFKSYLTTVIQLSEFEGELEADLNLSGNVSKNYIQGKGTIGVSDFKMIDPENKPLVTMGEFFIDILQINNKENQYDFKDILADDIQVNFEYLPNGDNFTKWLVTDGTVSEESHTAIDHYVSPFEMLSIYIYDMTRDYIFKSYTAKKIELTNFNLKFQDYTLEDPFYMDLQNVDIKSNDIKPENQFAKFAIDGKMNGTAKLQGNLEVSRQGVENMNIDMSVNGLFLNRFSPYSRVYTAHRLVEGISSFQNKSIIKNSYLKSTNTLHIENVKVSKKDKTRNGSSLPMRLAVALMKDSKGNINLDIPIEGPINDPTYKYGKVIWQVVKNLFTKAITSPVKSLASIFKVNEKDLKNIYFDNGQKKIGPLQKKSLNSIVKVLNKKPSLKIVLTHLYNKEYEFDAIALKNAKLAYLKQSDIKLDTKIPIGKQAFDLPTTDPEFLTYLKKETLNYDETISVPENARRLIGDEILKVDLEEVIKKQKALIKAYLITEKGITENRFIIKDGATSDEALNQSRPKFEVSFNAEE